MTHDRHEHEAATVHSYEWRDGQLRHTGARRERVPSATGAGSDIGASRFSGNDRGPASPYPPKNMGPFSGDDGGSLFRPDRHGSHRKSGDDGGSHPAGPRGVSQFAAADEGQPPPVTLMTYGALLFERQMLMDAIDGTHLRGFDEVARDGRREQYRQRVGMVQAEIGARDRAASNARDEVDAWNRGFETGGPAEKSGEPAGAGRGREWPAGPASASVGEKAPSDAPDTDKAPPSSGDGNSDRPLRFFTDAQLNDREKLRQLQQRFAGDDIDRIRDERLARMGVKRRVPLAGAGPAEFANRAAAGGFTRFPRADVPAGDPQPSRWIVQLEVTAADAAGAMSFAVQEIIDHWPGVTLLAALEAAGFKASPAAEPAEDRAPFVFELPLRDPDIRDLEHAWHYAGAEIGEAVNTVRERGGLVSDGLRKIGGRIRVAADVSHETPTERVVGVVGGIGHAMHELERGNRVARDGWNGKDMWLVLVHPAEFVRSDRPYFRLYGPSEEGSKAMPERWVPMIMLRTAGGKLVPWCPSQTDLRAADWRIVG